MQCRNGHGPNQDYIDSTHGGDENGGDTSSEDAIQEDRERFVDDLHILTSHVCADEPDHIITIKIKIKEIK